jgi:hypothetical protein
VNGRPFYGWWIVAAGFGLEALIGALMFHATGSYVLGFSILAGLAATGSTFFLLASRPRRPAGP